MTYRRGRKPRRDPHDPAVLAKKLPVKLRTFDAGGWLRQDGGRPTGLRDYMQSLLDWLADELNTGEVPHGLVLEIMRRGPGVPADWYRAMLGSAPDPGLQVG